MKYLIMRLILAVPTLLGLSLMIFSTIAFLPLRVRQNLFGNPHDTFIVQWIAWLERVLQGDLGFSRTMTVSVMDGILRSFGATLEIVMYSAPIIIVLGYKLGVLSAKRAHKKAPRGDIADQTVRVATAIGYSTPAFSLGLFLLLIFYLGFHWPAIGRLGLKAEIFVYSSAFTRYTGLNTVDALLNGQPWILFDALQHLTLPILTLTVTMLPTIIMVTRASMMDELSKPYIVLAKAKGLNEKEVIGHAKKLSMFPVFTVSGIIVASMLTGVVVVEYIFAIYGLGYWLVRAVMRWDYSLILGISLLFAAIFIIANIIVDVAYTYLDPRIKV